MIINDVKIPRDDEKYKRLLYSIRMANIHSLITDSEYQRAFNKLYKLIGKENKMEFKDIDQYIESIWWTCGDVIKIKE